MSSNSSVCVKMKCDGAFIQSINIACCFQFMKMKFWQVLFNSFFHIECLILAMYVSYMLRNMRKCRVAVWKFRSVYIVNWQRTFSLFDQVPWVINYIFVCLHVVLPSIPFDLICNKLLSRKKNYFSPWPNPRSPNGAFDQRVQTKICVLYIYIFIFCTTVY